MRICDLLRARETGETNKAKRHQIECNEDALVELPGAWIPVRLEHNGYPTALRKA